ncbi:thiamine-phosphate kinase [Altererythrobacter sp. Z27]|uniref:thiamine-phosphate kinase n=1 Tax=Altererythrobacter sp. Z27 TaxID=3461147 RepID=UPI004044BC90
MTSEAKFIEALRKLLLHPAARGLEDDCAVLSIGGETLVLTHDMMAEGTHFPVGADMADVAWKLVAVNLSDLAAKGAEPIGVLLGHMLGEGDERFLEGLGEVLRTYAVPLLGGDTIRGTGRSEGARAFGLTAIGRATHVPVPDRRGARPGDSVYVTGTLGRAMLGFEQGQGTGAYGEAYTRPRPLLGEGRALAPQVTAMMDISDGLLLDAWRLGEASRVTLALDSAHFPVADPARRDDCVRWGDDYELLFAAPAGTALPVEATRIGTVAARGASALLVDGNPMSPQDGLGYRH